jgi:hypothetical protein
MLPMFLHQTLSSIDWNQQKIVFQTPSKSRGVDFGESAALRDKTLKRYCGHFLDLKIILSVSENEVPFDKGTLQFAGYKDFTVWGYLNDGQNSEQVELLNTGNADLVENSLNFYKQHKTFPKL